MSNCVQGVLQARSGESGTSMNNAIPVLSRVIPRYPALSRTLTRECYLSTGIHSRNTLLFFEFWESVFLSTSGKRTCTRHFRQEGIEKAPFFVHTAFCRSFSPINTRLNPTFPLGVFFDSLRENPRLDLGLYFREFKKRLRSQEWK